MAATSRAKYPGVLDPPAMWDKPTPSSKEALVLDDHLVTFRRDLKCLETSDAFRSEVWKEAKQFFWVSLILQRMAVKLLWAIPLVWVRDTLSLTWDLLRWATRSVAVEVSFLLWSLWRRWLLGVRYPSGAARYQRRRPILPGWFEDRLVGAGVVAVVGWLSWYLWLRFYQ